MTDKFKFRTSDNIGAAAAEDDKKFLTDCFIDNGTLEELLNTSIRSRKIIKAFVQVFATPAQPDSSPNVSRIFSATAFGSE
jgi:hypothetical protein